MIELKNKSPKVLVIGDMIVDHYLWGSCERISPEAPVQIVNVSKESISLGGAGNVINNLITLGAKVDTISVIGDNETSNELITLFKKIGVNCKYLYKQNKRTTSKKTRIISSQQQVVRYDLESSNLISKESEEFILTTFVNIVSHYEIILISDYGKGVLTNKLTKSLISVANKFNKKNNRFKIN